MGLMIHSLNEIPGDIERSYYIYLLDYGWKESLADVIMKNLDKISDLASKNDAVFIKGTIGSHVDTEVMSWHNINGEKGDDVLPAILITTENPHNFRNLLELGTKEFNSKILIIPISSVCKTNEDVIKLLNTIFNDISGKKELVNFSIKKEMKKGVGKRLIDGLILQPNFIGMGFDFKKFFEKNA